MNGISAENGFELEPPQQATMHGGEAGGLAVPDINSYFVKPLLLLV